MKKGRAEECCERFDPKPLDGVELQWEGKRFVRARTRCFLHIPLNLGAVLKRNLGLIEAAGAEVEGRLTMTDEKSPWHADVYIEVSRDVPGATMATLSGTFLCKVFEGPFRNAQRWLEEMRAFVRSKGKTLRKPYFAYTTCPRCAKKYGKNYVVIVGQV